MHLILMEFNQKLKTIMRGDESYSQDSCSTGPRKRTKYAKISLKAKLVFYEKVLHQSGNLKEVNDILHRSPKN